MGSFVGLKGATALTSTAGFKHVRTIVDPLLDGDNGGVQFLFDLPSRAGYSKQAAPANGDAIKNLSTATGIMAVGDGAASLGTTETTYSGGGWDFTPLTNTPATVRGPVGTLQSIHDAANDYFMVVGYWKLPVSADWDTVARIAAMFCCTSTVGGYATPEVDMLTIAQTNSPQLSFRRQTNGGATVSALTITPATAAYGQLAQIAYYRNAAGAQGRLRTATTDQLTSVGAAADNSGDFSSQQPRWGVPTSWNDLTGGTNGTAHKAASNCRLYRGWIEDLTLSGRDPTTVLNADWTRVQARITADAAAHSGTSTIFV